MPNRRPNSLTPRAPGPPSDGRPGSPSYVARLRETQIVKSKPVLPAEILDQILDLLPVLDLMRWARVSKKLQEMVYEDTRWVQKLKILGCWDEMEARKRFEDAMRKQVEAHRGKESREGPLNTTGRPEHLGSTDSAIHKQTLFDARFEEHKQNSPTHRKAAYSRDGGSKELHNISPVPSRTTASPTRSRREEMKSTLHVFEQVRSIRGQARQEYSKIYAALAPFYSDLIRSRSHADPLVFRSYKDPEEQAKMLAQLRTFSKGDTTSDWQTRVDKLESMLSLFESAVLREFEQGQENGDIDGRMRRYAHVLVTLNGGQSGIEVFIHNNRLLANKDGLGNPFACIDGISSGNANLGPARDFFQRLTSSVNEESKIIDRVFPTTVDVMVPLLDRVSEEIIAEYITPLLDEAHRIDIHSYLKLTNGIYDQALRFLKAIQPPKGSEGNFSDVAIDLINRCFEPHIDLYLQEELEFFRSRSNTEVGFWEKRLVEQEAQTDSIFMGGFNRQAEKRDFMTSFKKAIMAPINVLPTIPTSSSTTSSNAKQSVSNEVNGTEKPQHLTPISGPTSDRPATPTSTARTSELAAKASSLNSKLESLGSLLSIEVALNIVHAAKASIERAALFVRLAGQSGAEAREQCDAIFVQLLQVLGSKHVKPGFDKALDHLSSYNARTVKSHNQSGPKPLVTFLELVNVGDLIQQMVDVFYQQDLVATKLVDPDDFLDPAVKEKKRFEQILDERVAAGLNKGIDVLMDEVEWIFATSQHPQDFNPPGLVADIEPSNTAKQIVKIIDSHTSMLVGSTEKTMLDVFNQEVGYRLFQVLCKHVKRQRISTDGALKLIADMNHYFAYIQTMKNKELLVYFRALRELSQIFLVDGKQAKELATIIADGDKYEGIFKAEEVLEFAERRADWYSIKSSVEKAMYGIGCTIM